MKLVIQTQFMENYAAHNSDYDPAVDEAYWKYKGGETFVYRNLSPSDALRISEEGIPKLTKLIEYSNSACREYILDWSLVDDDCEECEDWETPWDLIYTEGRWTASRYVEADMHWQADVGGKFEVYVMTDEGGRDDYKCEYYKRAA